MAHTHLAGSLDDCCMNIVIKYVNVALVVFVFTNVIQVAFENNWLTDELSLRQRGLILMCTQGFLTVASIQFSSVFCTYEMFILQTLI